MAVLDFVFAFLLDLLFGDPPRIPHPVRGIGWLISTLEKWLRRKFSRPAALRAGGIILVVALTGLIYILSFGLLILSYKIHEVLGYIALIYLAYTTLSLRSLRDAAVGVLRPLEADDLSSARRNLSALVGRPTENLDSKGVIRATVESVAENTSDGIVAPLFYLAVGGVPLAMAYKTINTLDSMIGYRTPAYRDLGWASARLDDLANYIPSRLTGLFISMSAGLYKTARPSLKIMLRDGRKHTSPNSGIPEAAMAGALGIQLGGPIFHPDKPGIRPWIGDLGEEPDPIHIQRAIHLMIVASLLALGGIIAVRSFLW